MAVLEGVVIVTIILAGIWVGYHVWDEWMHSSPDDAKAHYTEPAQTMSHTDAMPHIVVQSTSWYGVV